MSLREPRAFRGKVTDSPQDMTDPQLRKYCLWIKARLNYLGDTNGKVSAFDRACLTYEPYLEEWERRLEGGISPNG